MIHQIKEYDQPILAIELIGGFTEYDFIEIEKLSKVKREKGFDKANILIKIEKLAISDSNAKAIMEQLIKILKNVKIFNRIAVVSDSQVLENLVKVDNLFLKLFNRDSEEKYFDKANLAKALTFIESI